MLETLKKKQIRLYEHFITAMERPMEHPLLYKMLLSNVSGRFMCRSPEDLPVDQTRQKLLYLEQRLCSIEHYVVHNEERTLALYNRMEQLERESRLRIAMLEQKQELFARVLVKLTKR